MARVGSDVESYCSKCKLMILHTVEAMVGSEPKRVQCNSCHSQHAYKAHLPGEAPARPRSSTGSVRASAGPKRAGAGGGRIRASDYERMMEGRNGADARRYSPKAIYKVGEVITHPTFGTGVATNLKDATKIEVLFQDGLRVLVHAR
jgi:hypothetical protein